MLCLTIAVVLFLKLQFITIFLVHYFEILYILYGKLNFYVKRYIFSTVCKFWKSCLMNREYYCISIVTKSNRYKLKGLFHKLLNTHIFSSLEFRLYFLLNCLLKSHLTNKFANCSFVFGTSYENVFLHLHKSQVHIRQ